MTVNNPLKLFSVCMLCTVMSACGDLFGAGGASLEGTGNGRPSPPGLGNAGDGDETDKEFDEAFPLLLSLNEPAYDHCSLVIRELQFIDPVENTPVLKKTVLHVNFNKDHAVPLTVQLTLENANAVPVQIEYPQCDVPVRLQDIKNAVQIFPADDCREIKTEVLQPDEIRTYRLNYNLDRVVDGQWDVHSKMKLIVPDSLEDACQPLPLHMGLNYKEDTQEPKMTGWRDLSMKHK
ncbi:hypothetical protein [Acinetobacter tianfuensis]|uniref:Lipoprotein n=1 Tax=Acinetobacter tianfuensis TaxID=2419603 RepID=A0A3A8ED29_9GAMM|nr:hypothetical protein [Acinetobacter tianfuensis]RKG32787.1 hypothetical protein D7V32_04790 [Acinetobacter tianfuensis]